MIRLIPLQDTQALVHLCQKHNVAYSESVHAYVSANPSVTANCIFSLEGYQVHLLFIEFDKNDALLAELLIRAVASYSANRSGYLFVIEKGLGESIEACLQVLQFEKNENGYYGKVPKILEGSCRCKNNSEK